MKMINAQAILLTILLPTLALTALGQARSFDPILPLKIDSKEVPLLEQVLAESSLLKLVKENKKSLPKLFQDADELKLRYEEDQGNEDLLRNLFETHGIISYILAGASGETSHYNEQRNLNQNLASVRGYLAIYGLSLFKIEEGENKYQALYVAAMANYLMNEKRTSSIQMLRSNLNSLPKDLQHKAKLVIALHNTRYGNSLSGAKELIALIPALEPKEKVVAYLTAAKFLVAYAKIKKLDKVDSEYREYLQNATAQFTDLATSTKSEILSFIITVWRQKEGEKGSWEDPPIIKSVLAETFLEKAFKERSALNHLANDKPLLAIKIYEDLARQTEDPTRLKLDYRLLEIKSLQYEKENIFAPYFDALIETEKRYRNDKIFGSQYSDRVKKAHERFKKIRDRSIIVHAESLKSRKASRSAKIHAIELLTMVINEANDREEKRKLRLILAQLHAANSQHRASVDEYLALMKSASESEKNKFLELAIMTQSQAADWPMTPTWQMRKKADKEEEKRFLLSLYNRLIKTGNENAYWTTLAHIGLLKVVLGEEADAFKIWTANLKRGKDNKYAAQAAGFMLTNYIKKKAIEEQKIIAKICLENKIAPLVGNSNLAITSLTAKLLFEGGKKAIEDNKSLQAETDLKTFVDNFPADPSHDEALYLLATVYKATGRTKLAIDTLVQLARAHPDSRRALTGLLAAIKWSKTLDPDLTLKLSKFFLSKYSTHPNSADVRDEMAAIFIRKKWYGDASRIYKAQSLSPAVPNNRQVLAALAFMMLEEKKGDPEIARWGATRVLNISKNEMAIAKALAFEAKYASNRKDRDQLETIYKRLRNMNGNNEEVRTASALTRSLLAKHGSNSLIKYDNVAVVAQFKKAVDRKYTQLLKLKQDQVKTCKSGNAASCAKIKRELSYLSNDTLKSLQKKAPKTADPRAANEFTSYKRGMIEKINKLSP